jgi:hypothetical protein
VEGPFGTPPKDIIDRQQSTQANHMLVTSSSLPSVEAPALEDEITPAMIKAGQDSILRRWGELVSDPSPELYSEVALEVYLAMLTARSRLFV